jgi:glycine cleavage system transcriptional repressor
MTATYLVLSALGPDRPGLVAQVSEHIAARGANVEQSRMALLGAEFGIMVLVSGEPAELERIEQELPSLEKLTGLSILTRRTLSPREHRAAPALPYVVTAESLDREGIVHAVALAIHGLGVNIVSLETSSFNAPFTGGELFRLEAQVDLPSARAVAQLRKVLAEVAERENLDVDIRSAGSQA